MERDDNRMARALVARPFHNPNQSGVGIRRDDPVLGIARHGTGKTYRNIRQQFAETAIRRKPDYQKGT